MNTNYYLSYIYKYNKFIKYNNLTRALYLFY